MNKNKIVLISGLILVITLLLYYSRNNVPLDITSSSLEKTLVYFGLLNTVLFTYLMIEFSIPKVLKVLTGILLITHGLLLTVYHVHWYADWEDVEILSRSEGDLTIKQVRKLGFDKKSDYRIITARELTPTIRVINNMQDVENDS